MPAHYDQNGFNPWGIHAETGTSFDPAGFNRSGYNADGYDRHGYDREGYNRDGFNAHGYDREGFNRSGRNRRGYKRDGIRQQMGAHSVGDSRDRWRFDQSGKHAVNDAEHDPGPPLLPAGPLDPSGCTGCVGVLILALYIAWSIYVAFAGTSCQPL